MPSKKSQKSQESSPKINGAIAAQACIYHWQRLRYHEAAGRTDVAKQHAEAYQTMLKSLNGARRRVVDLATPVIQPYQGPEVTTFVDFVIPERVEGVGIGLEIAPELKEKLVAKAAQEGRSLRALIREALEKLVA